MASTAATATMAAATSTDKRASTAASTLQTPASGTFPSELRSPLVGSPGFLKKQESDLKTPITPPSAYLEFLKNMTPAMMSPAPTSTSARFSFHERNTDKPASDAEKPSTSPPTSQPALSRNTSYDSTSSANTTSTDQSAASFSSKASTATRTRPESPRIAIPASTFAKPAPRSARTPRRLHIPQSPFSPAIGSAQSISSPYTSTPLSAAPWSATFSPTHVDPETNGKPGRVSVRQVVTRTVTYCRTPLEPAPKGKRRKLEAEAAEETPSESSPPIKQEPQDHTSSSSSSNPTEDA